MMQGRTESNVRVFVRIKPQTHKQQLSSCFKVNGNGLTVDSRPPECFTFDWVAGPEVNQEGIFERIGKPIADSCLAGYNGTIFVYGQTGSGKTYTLHGGMDNGRLVNEERGIMPRLFEYVFGYIANKKRTGSTNQYHCKCSFLEIYNEQITDLLNPGANRLQLRDDQKRGVYVENLTEMNADDSEMVMKYLATGSQNRHVGSTAVNEQSSRSHSVFTLYITSIEKKNDIPVIRSSRLHLIDLAGSERQKSTHSSGTQLKEASHINNTLTSLGKVIRALVGGPKQYVSYRESKLTFLLRDSLGGNSMTSMIATVCQSPQYFGETISTLKFAQRAKLIKNKVTVNEDLPAVHEKELKQEIKKLEARLAIYESTAPIGGGGGSLDGDLFLDSDIKDGDMKDVEQLLFQSLYKIGELEKSKKMLNEKLEKTQSLASLQADYIRDRNVVIQILEKKINRLRNDCDGMDESEAINELIQHLFTQNNCVENHPALLRLQVVVSELMEVNQSYRATYDEDIKLRTLEMDRLRSFYYNLVVRMRKVIQQKYALLKRLSDVSYEILIPTPELKWQEDKTVDELEAEMDSLRQELLEERRGFSNLRMEYIKEQRLNKNLQEQVKMLSNNLFSLSPGGFTQKSHYLPSIPFNDEENQQKLHAAEIKLATAEFKILELEGQSSEFAGQIATLGATVSRLETEKQQIFQEVRELQKQNQFIKEESESLMKENTELSTSLKEKGKFEGEVFTLENELSALKRKFQTLTDEHTALREETDLLQKERDYRGTVVSQHEKMVEEQKQENAHLSRELSHYKQEAIKLKNELELTKELNLKSDDDQKLKITQFLNEISTLNESLEKERVRIGALEEDLKNKNLEISTLKAQLCREANETESIRSVWMEVRAELDNKNRKFEELEGTLKDKSEEVDLLKANELTILQEKNALIEEKNQLLIVKIKLEEDIKNLETRNDMNIREYERAVEMFKRDFQANKCEYERVIDKLKEFQQANHSLKEGLTNANLEIQRLREHSERMQVDVEMTTLNEEKLLEMEEKFRMMTLKERKIEEEKFLAETEVRTLRESVDNTRTENSSLKEKLKEIEKKYETMEHQYVQLNTQLKSTEETLQKLEEENNKLSGHTNAKQKIQFHQQIKKEYNALKMEKDQLTKEMVKKDQMIKKLQTDLKGQTGKPTIPTQIDQKVSNKIFQMYSLLNPKQDVKNKSVEKCLEAIESSLRDLNNETKENGNVRNVPASTTQQPQQQQQQKTKSNLTLVEIN